MSLFIGMIVVGILVIFGAVIYASFNMFSHVSRSFDRPRHSLGRPAGGFDRKRDAPSDGPKGVFTRHLGAIIVCQVAGFVLTMGIIGAVLTYLGLI